MRSRTFTLVTLILGTMSMLMFQPATAQAETYHRFSPTAIYADGHDSTTLELFTVGGDVAAVTLKPEFADEPNYPLFDDGTNGDRTAGDGVYSLEGISTAMFPDDLLFPISYHENGIDIALATVWLTAEIAYTNGQTETISYMELRTVSPDIEFPVEQVANGLYASEYAFFIVDPAGETYSGNFPNISDYDGPAITRKFYSVYPDEFDFINFMVVRGDLGMKAHSGGLRDPAENLGINRADYTAEYGSQGRLLAMTYSGFELLNHEIGHTWSAFLGTEQGISDGAHWVGNTDISGVMSEGYETSDGLYFFTPNGDGTFKADWAEGLFAPLELYLMGLIHPDEVPDVHILHDPDLTNLERVTAQSVETHTIEEIAAAAGGSRLPAYPDAPTNFNLAILLLSDAKFSPAEFAFFSFLSQQYSAQQSVGAMVNFFTATGGRGTINTRLADWGIPNIQATFETGATQTSLPAPTPQSSQNHPTAQVETSTPQFTEAPRPVFNFPICTGALVLPVLLSVWWIFRNIF